MRYRVAYMERTAASGEPSESPSDYVAIHVPDGVVLDKEFIERTEPQASHTEHAPDEDDDFLSVGSELWEYEVRDDRGPEFEDALKRSQMVMEYEVIEDATDGEMRPA